MGNRSRCWFFWWNSEILDMINNSSMGLVLTIDILTYPFVMRIIYRKFAFKKIYGFKWCKDWENKLGDWKGDKV